MKTFRFISLVMLIFLGFVLSGCEGTVELGDNEVKVKASASSLVGTQYEEVVEQLEAWGFTNIETEAVYDIVWGITKEGTTKSVKIGGSESFTSGDVYDKNVSVLVTYSMKVSNDPTKQKYTITWQYEDGTVIKIEDVLWGNIPSYTGEVPVKTSTNEIKYTFSGWTPELEPVTENETYTAAFVEVENSFIVNYDLDGGQWELENTQSILYNGLITSTIPSKNGYDFAGWVIKGFWSDTQFDSTTNVKQDYTLTANWTAVKYTVSFDLDGGVWSRSDEQSLDYNDKITTIIPTKDGHNFVGWLFNDVEFDINTQVTGNLNLKAQWELPNYEDVLIGRWEAVYASSKAYGFSFIEFDGYFYDLEGQRTSGMRDFDYNWGSFTLYGNKMGVNYVDAGTIYFTISYNSVNDQITFKNSNYLDIVLQRTEDEPNSLAWKWNHLYEFAKTQSSLKNDELGYYYEITMNLTIRNISPNNILVESKEQIIRVYLSKIVNVTFTYVGVNDPNIEMEITFAIIYDDIANNTITDPYIRIESENYIMGATKGTTIIEFDKEAGLFFFTTTNLQDYVNNFPVSNTTALYNLMYFIENTLYEVSYYLLVEHGIYLFTT